MIQLPRRTFLKSLSSSVIAAPAIVRASVLAAGNAPRLPIAFSTLGCPKWDWKTILKNAAEWGFAAIEMRGLLDQMDLPKSPQFMGDNIKTSQRDLKALGLKISDLGASAHLHEPDPKKRAEQMDEAKRFIDLAYSLGVPYVRVFPDKLVPGEERRITVERIIEGMRELGKYARGANVTVILESHGDFTDSPTLLQIMKGAQMTTTGFLWDAHHTFVYSKEKPQQTYNVLGKFVRHTHLKDSVANGKERRHVLTGAGEVPVKETVQVLKAAGYKGYYSLEWEKRWHPEIEEPEIAFPQYAKIIREYLTETKEVTNEK
ncbi:MAG TPA: sugar phosphate isomerase/epimerase family protein [Blastocatellia bacterium]|nr:sugar phosphate isomerase/epimerase family protein [Blastocatellia bacterium]